MGHHLREYMKLKYVGDCKCGKCQLVPMAVLQEASGQHGSLVEALESAVASLEQFVKLGRIPANNQGLRDARAALALATKET